MSHTGDVHFCLSHTDSLYNNHSALGGVENTNHIACRHCQASQISPGSHASDEYTGILGQISHPNSIAQNSTTRKRTGGIHSHNTDFNISNTITLRHRTNQSALAGSRGPGDTDHMRMPGMPVESGHNPLCGRTTSLHQGNRLSHGPPASSKHSSHQGIDPRSKPVVILRHELCDPRQPAGQNRPPPPWKCQVQIHHQRPAS